MDMDPKKVPPKPKINGLEKDTDMYDHINLGLAFFVMVVILYVINFIYLFKKNTEYLAWILAFILNAIFPITWVMSIMKYPGSTYKNYLFGCITIGLILEFTALLITVITNSIVQERSGIYEKNKRTEENPDPTIDVPNKTTYDTIVNSISGTIAGIVSMNHALSAYFNSNKKDGNPRRKQKSFHVADKIKENNEINKKLYTTTSVLIIGAISNYFIDQRNSELEKGLPAKTALGNNIHWWLTFIPRKLEEFGDMWQRIVSDIPIDPFFRSFLLFCIGFLIFMFSFVRVFPNFREINDPYLNENGVKGYVMNMYFDIPKFPNIYNQSAGPVNFQVLISFFFALFMFIIIPFLATIFNMRSVASFVLLENPSMINIILYIGWLLLFIVPLISGITTQTPVGVTNAGTNGLLMTIIGFLFAVLGTPVLFMVVELLSRLFNLPLSRYLKRGWNNPIDENLFNSIGNNLPFTNGRSPSDPYNWIMLFILFAFFGVWFGIMVAGITGKWLDNAGNGKIIKFIIIFIISMIIGWCLALSPYFNVFSILTNITLVPVKMVLYFLAPITIFALSTTQLALADQASKVTGKVTDG